MKECPRQESNLVSDLRKVVCGSGTLRGRDNRAGNPPPGNRTRPCGFEDRRAPDTLAGSLESHALARSRTWSATFGGSRANPSHSKGGYPENVTVSRDARIRTLSASFGGSLLSQEHIPIQIDLSGYSAGVEPDASRFTFSRASVTPRTPTARLGPIAGGRSGRGGSRTRKARRSPAFQAGPVADRVALPSSNRSRTPSRSGPGWTRTTDLPHVKGTSWPLDDGTPCVRETDNAPARTRTRNSSLEARHDLPFHHGGH